MSKPSKPLVTLGIMAYNQQDLILETIKGAFAQTYSPLEIILSDDHSTDGTFAVMEQAAREYTGPHRIVVNKNSRNLCMIGHLLAVSDLAKGELLVQNDGDDISLPHRVETLAAIWQNEKPTAMFSHFELIGERGQTLQRHCSRDIKSGLVEQTFARPAEMNILGATAAYDLSFIRALPRPQGRYYFEDEYMTFMVHLHNGAIRKVMQPLVRYRQHAASMTNGGRVTKFADIKSMHLKAAHQGKNLVELYGFFGHEVGKKLTRETPGHPIDLAALHDQKALAAVKAEWITMGPLGRLVAFLKKRNQPIRSWLAPRLLGLNAFAALRYATNLAAGKKADKPASQRETSKIIPIVVTMDLSGIEAPILTLATKAMANSPGAASQVQSWITLFPGILSI